MTDKEFKRLGRAQLIDIIYQLQLQVDALTQQKQELEEALEDKRLRMLNAGNIAEAALELNNCFRSAQDAANQYLDEIKAMREETEAEREQILARARAEAEQILAQAKNTPANYDSAMEEILKEYGHSDNG